jgi:hypothetical protein
MTQHSMASSPHTHADTPPPPMAQLRLGHDRLRLTSCMYFREVVASGIYGNNMWTESRSMPFRYLFHPPPPTLKTRAFTTHNPLRAPSIPSCFQDERRGSLRLTTTRRAPHPLPLSKRARRDLTTHNDPPYVPSISSCLQKSPEGLYDPPRAPSTPSRSQNERGGSSPPTGTSYTTHPTPSLYLILLLNYSTYY